MAKRIFITATNTDVGKTYTTIKLLHEYASRGLRVGAIKPIETGVFDTPSDGLKLLNTLQTLNSDFENLGIESIVPISYELPAAPYVASNGKKLDLETLDRSVEKLDEMCDVLLIEGAGGLFVPLDEDFMIIDLIKRFRSRALLVTHCSLGCINDSILSSKALDEYNISHTVAFNCKCDDSNFKIVSKPYFDGVGFSVMQVDEDIADIADRLLNI